MPPELTATAPPPAAPARAPAAPGLAGLVPGQRFEGAFACVRKDRLTGRNGAAYLALELRDRTGTMPARVFRDADRLATRFERGDAVAATGKVERYRGELVATLEDVLRLEPGTFDPGEFLPSAYRSVSELEGFLEHLIREIHEAPLRALVENLVAGGEHAAEFRRAPCTRAGHHAYLGGLIEHTVAVGTLVLETCQLHPRLDSDLLMAAALIHDIGKVSEFTYGAEFGLTEEGRLLGHLAIGAQIIGAAAAGIEQKRRAALLHCVLAHHGPPADAGARGGRSGFGSPEALALHRLNALDASVKAALERGL